MRPIKTSTAAPTLRMQPTTLLRAPWLRSFAMLAGMLPVPILAQTVAPPVTLPTVTVEGATLDVKPVKREPQTATIPEKAKPAQPPSTPNAVGQQRPDSSSTQVAPQPPAVVDPWAVTTDLLGSSVSVVTRQDLDHQQTRYAADALRGVPGVSVSRTGGFAGLSQVRIRGGEANHTLVLIDGVEANQATNGEFDFSNMPAEGIERIEVIKGPQSGLVGSNAIGGVVNIITRRGEGPLSIQLKSEYGSMQTRDVAAIVSGGNAQMHGAMTFASRTSNGFNIAPFGDEADFAKSQLFAFKGGARPFENFSLDFTARRTIKQGGRDDDAEFPVGGFSTQTDTASRFKWNVLLMGMEAKLDTFDRAWTHAFRASTNRTSYEDTADTPAFFNVYRDTSSVEKLAYLSTLRFATEPVLSARHTVTAMIENERETYTAVSTDNEKRERARVNTALEWRGVFLDALALGATVRRDDNQAMQDFTTWRSSASLKLPPALQGALVVRPHTSIGTGVKYPTMFELYGFIPTFFTPNPNLLAETSTGWDAGLETTWWGGRAVVDVTWFSADVENKISGPLGGPPVNLTGVSHHQGIETTARFQLMGNVTLALGHTWLDARDNVGLSELRRPSSSASGTLTAGFSEGQGKVSVSARYTGTSVDQGFRLGEGDFFGFKFTTFNPERVQMDDYWLIGLSASYKIQPNVELFGRVENLLDTRYQEVFGYENAGAAVYGGIKIKLEATDGK